MNSAYPKQLKTIGHHLRKRRLDLKLLQQEVAVRLGVTESSIWSWESNASCPHWRYWPAIVEFLGYNAFPEPTTLGGKLALHRKLHGFSQKELAKTLGVDPSTLAHWEQRGKKPTGLYRGLVDAFLAGGQSSQSRSTDKQFAAGRLIAARRRAGLSPAALAKRLGVSVHTLRRWERGDRQPQGLCRQAVLSFVEDQFRKDTP